MSASKASGRCASGVTSSKALSYTTLCVTVNAISRFMVLVLTYRESSQENAVNGASQMTVIGACAFCKQQASLRDSHVLPAFVFRWLRGRSGGGGHIRHTENVNRRVQDGLKQPWLCDSCEGRFSRFETAFATKLFHPWHEGNNRVAYGDWLLKFCASVSWRVLCFARGRNKDAQYTPEQERLMDRAEEKWRSFLKDDVSNPGEFEQHLLIFDLIESTTVADLPTNINRFMTGAVTLDIVGSERSLMTFAKLGRFNIFGLIQKGSSAWEGTKVHVKHGLVAPGNFTIPAGLLPLLKEKAAHTAAAMNSMSAAQSAKVQQNIVDNMDRFVGSDQFASIAADVDMFGSGAFSKSS